MIDQYTKEELQVIIDRAVKYVNSKKGQRSIAAADNKGKPILNSCAQKALL